MICCKCGMNKFDGYFCNHCGSKGGNKNGRNTKSKRNGRTRINVR